MSSVVGVTVMVSGVGMGMAFALMLSIVREVRIERKSVSTGGAWRKPWSGRGSLSLDGGRRRGGRLVRLCCKWLVMWCDINGTGSFTHAGFPGASFSVRLRGLPFKKIFPFCVGRAKQTLVDLHE